MHSLRSLENMNTNMAHRLGDKTMRKTDYLKFDEQLKAILDSKEELCLPNVKEVTDPQEALNLINRAYIKFPHESPYYFLVQTFDPPKEFYPGNFQTREVAYRPRIWLNGGGMGNRFDGSGVFMCTPSGRNDGKARVFTFAFCEHEWDESGANHSRGWHPKVCTKCGFDASIDSGD